MDKTIRIYHSLDEMKADEYRYWRNRPAHERMDAVEEITLAIYAMKGVDLRGAGGVWGPLQGFHVEDLAEPNHFIRLDGSRAPSIFFPASTALISTPHGTGAFKASSTRKAA